MRERGDRRPVLVLTRDPAIRLLTWVTVAPAARTVREIPTEVRLGPSDGMPRDCVLSLDNVKTVPKRSLETKITRLSDARMEEVCDRLAYALGC